MLNYSQSVQWGRPRLEHSLYLTNTARLAVRSGHIDLICDQLEVHLDTLILLVIKFTQQTLLNFDLPPMHLRCAHLISPTLLSSEEDLRNSCDHSQERLGKKTNTRHLKERPGFKLSQGYQSPCTSSDFSALFAHCPAACLAQLGLFWETYQETVWSYLGSQMEVLQKEMSLSYQKNHWFIHAYSF